MRLMEHPTDVRALGRLDDWYPTAVYENPLYDKSASLRVEEAVPPELAAAEGEAAAGEEGAEAGEAGPEGAGQSEG